MDDPDEILDDLDGPHIVLYVLVALLFIGALCVGLELAGVLTPGYEPRGEDLMCSACIPKIKATAEKLGISEDEVSSILYEHTDFPFGSMEETWQQADEYVAARLRSADA